MLSSYGVGGQERVALDLAAGQLEAGHDVAVISLAAPPDGPLVTEFRDAGVQTHTIPKRGGLDPTLTPRLAWWLRRHRAEIVHSHNPLPLIYAAPAARLAGARAIHTKHGVNPGSRGHRLLRRAAAQLVSSFVAVSSVTAEQARAQRDCPLDRLVVIPNGIRLERFHPDPEARAAVRRELDIPASAFVVGTVGRVDDYKNQPMLIAAMAPLLGPDVRVIVVGDGPARAQLDSAVAALASARYAHILGRRMDVSRLLAAFDVFALPSKTEGLPLVVPEAMSTGLPVIATAVGGLPGVVDEGSTGHLIPIEEVALRTAITDLLNDPVRRVTMGAKARSVALTRYAAARMVNDYLLLYQRAHQA